MQLVSGQNAKTLTQAIRELHENSLDMQSATLLRRQLLGRLIDVCNTVAYAHSQGVCHRDLKPANILIGPFGETLVVDWGLAKFYKDPNPIPKSRGAGLFKKSSDASIDDSSSPPLSRTHSDGVGTRGYVAPECYREEPIVDWPRLDVYSLGAILYCILTGQSPGGESKTSSVAKISKYQFPTPRRINPDVPKALEAICLKALCLERELRYSTPLELSSDIERFLAGQPVSVLRDGLVDRVVRWVNNNRKLATAMLVFGSLLFLAIGVIAFQQFTYNASLSEKSQKLADSLTKESDLRDKEQKARELAQVQEQIALDRELLALQALRTYTEAITSNETLRNSQGLGQVRRELLEKPIALFEQIQQGKTRMLNPSWEYIEQLAKMSEELAKLSFEYGDPLQCSRWNDRTIELYDELVSKSQDPKGSAVSADEKNRRTMVATLALAGSHRLRGVLQGPMDKQSSEASLRQALELLGKISDDPLWKESLLNEFANVHGYQAILQAEQGNVEGMATNFDLAIKEREELLEFAKAKSSSSSQTSNAQSSNAFLASREADLENLKQDQAHVGLVLRHGDSQSHFQQMEKHIVFLKKQIEQGINLEHNRLRLTWATRNLAVHLQSYGQIDKSTAMLHEALELRRQMTARYPSVTRYRVDLASTAIDLAGDWNVD
jgi:tetratricopeptide (TPR) repeat protein